MLTQNITERQDIKSFDANAFTETKYDYWQSIDTNDRERLTLLMALVYSFLFS